ncbi:MAG: type I-C CRISPR-associated protein Cas5c [Treponema sp.]|jgi:CRISPR-associated protein Cas5d|nr:type I-C CRISPR-associated protein Cas5c [Treponema sp.]
MKDWCLEVWGDYACFSRPEMKVERVSYDVMTPSAARAIFDAILWKPSISWHINKIEVLKPLKWMSLRRNEVGKIVISPSQAQLDGKDGKPMGINIEDARQQRAGLFLRDVCYRIHGWFEFIPPEKRKPHYNRYKEVWADSGEANEFIRADDSEAKYAAMFERRARKGQCFHRPYLGCREFACYFKLIEEPTPVQTINVSDDLGWMLYDMNYDDLANIRPEFFRARLENGVVNTDRRVVEVRS